MTAPLLIDGRKNGLSRRSFLCASAAVSALAFPSFGRTAVRALVRDRFIEDLLARMSLEDKAGQLTTTAGPVKGWRINPAVGPELAPEQAANDVAAGRVTGYFNWYDMGACRALQTIAVERSPHKIPLIFGGDVIHGLKTAFPVPLGEASSFDPELCYRTARAAATEASALGIHWVFAPMVDVARDQRWGRVVEGAGEDVWLGSQIAEARVRGFQGDGLHAEDAVLACPKHFAAYGAVQGGMEYNTADIPETTLRETFLPPFKAAFAAGALSTMAAFNDIAGVPATADRHLLTGILRDEWGFKGFVVSDYSAIPQLVTQDFAIDDVDATIKALTAGCDMDMMGNLYLRHIPALVRSGRLPQRVVDEAVRRVLRVKKALGLFDNPYRGLDVARAARHVGTPEITAIAREAARKSLVLLKNEGGLLPLPKSGKAIALIGPFVSDHQSLLGPWMMISEEDRAITLEDGVRAAIGPDTRLTVVAGSGIDEPVPGGIAAAVAAARAADIVVLHIGEGVRMSGEANSRVEITIPAAQIALAEAVAATGKPMVVILKHGRALALSGAIRNAPAILCGWFLGTESGHAIADVLFGDFAPCGRLPVSFPQASGQEPFYYDHRTTGRPQVSAETAFKTRYREVTNEALYAFGHGLGYSQVEYGAVRLSADRLAMAGSLRVSATVTNIGRRPQHEVVQLYLHHRSAEVVQPRRSLKGMKHVDLAPGQSATVEFIITPAELEYVHRDLTTRADPGRFDVYIAPSSVSGVPAQFALS